MYCSACSGEEAVFCFVLNLVFITRYMRPGGPWQQLSPPIKSTSFHSIDNPAPPIASRHRPTPLSNPPLPASPPGCREQSRGGVIPPVLARFPQQPTPTAPNCAPNSTQKHKRTPTAHSTCQVAPKTVVSRNLHRRSRCLPASYPLPPSHRPQLRGISAPRR